MTTGPSDATAGPPDTFGARLRAARRSAGLTQATLGGDDYTASYISLLESGRRRPTRAVVQALAGRLGVAVDTLGYADGAELDAWTRWLPVEQKARLAWTRGEFDQVLRLADGLLADLDQSQPGATAVDFAARLLIAQARLPLDQHDACSREAHRLLEHPVAASSPELRCVLWALASRAERADGRLDEALRSAERAVEVSTGKAVADDVYSDALITLVSVLADSGRLDRATAVAEELAAVADRLTDEHAAAMAHWALGNIHLLRHDVAAGISAHDLAHRLLSRREDPRTFGRFLKAAASRRARAGCLEGVDDLLEQATRWLDLVGNQSDLDELAVTRAAARVLAGEPARALKLLDDLRLDAAASTLVAEAHEVACRAHLALGNDAAARAEALTASRILEATGALPRAVALLQELASDREGHASGDQRSDGSQPDRGVAPS